MLNFVCSKSPNSVQTEVMQREVPEKYHNHRTAHQEHLDTETAIIFNQQLDRLPTNVHNETPNKTKGKTRPVMTQWLQSV